MTIAAQATIAHPSTAASGRGLLRRAPVRVAQYGKTFLETGFDLGFRVAQVDQYVAEAKESLGARNRARALAEAVERAEI